MKQEFNVGDRVKVSKENTNNREFNGLVGTIKKNDLSSVPFKILFDNYEGKRDYEGWVNQVELVKAGKKEKEEPEDLTRFMVYGTGCRNKSELVETEQELKEEVKRLANNEDWSGRTIGYKLTPLFEAEKKTILKTFKTDSKKVKKITKKRK